LLRRFEVDAIELRDDKSDAGPIDSTSV